MRKHLLGLLFALSLAPAFAQVPPPVPALPDAERRTTYSITASTCACNVNFALYGDSANIDAWVEVWISGTRYLSTDTSHGWSLSSTTGPLASIARPITNAVLTFNAAQTGVVQIVGARRPIRASQFNENQGVPARNLNQVLTDIVAQNRETWDRTNDVTGRALLTKPGDTIGQLPSAASRASTILGFNASGDPLVLNPNIGTGTVIGPASTVDGHVAVFDGPSGQIIRDGGTAVGTVLNITAGKNLTGGTITSSGTIALSDTPTLGTAGSVLGTLSFANLTSGTIKLQAPTGALGTNVLTWPVATDTLVGKATTDTFTNKTFDTAGTGNSFSINGLPATTNTGTGAVVRDTSAAVSSMTLTGSAFQGGTASALTSFGIRSTGAAFDLQIASTEVFSASRTLTVTLNNSARLLNLGGDLVLGGSFTTAGANPVTLTTTGSTNVTMPLTGTLATLAGVETLSNKTLVAPALGAATATSINKMAITAPATGSTFAVADGKSAVFSNSLTLTGTDGTSFAFPAVSDTVAALATAQTFTKQNSYNIATTVASASGATLDDINVPAATTTVTGNTNITTTKGFNKVGIYRPTITDSSSVTINNSSSLYVDNAPLAAGSVTITNPWAISVGAGNVSFPGTGNALGTITSGIWNGTKVGLAYGGTNADLSATGGTANFLKQSTVGGNISVGTIGSGDLSGSYTGITGVGTITAGVWNGTAITGANIGTNTVTNTNLAQMAAVTLKGNPTASGANATDFTLAGLTSLATPDASNDLLLIWDHTAGTLKKTTPGAVAAAATAGVSSLNGLTGGLTAVAGTGGVSIAAAASSVTFNNTQVGPPQGRLTLISNTPAPTSSQAAATTLYYTPAVGTYVPTTGDGSTFQMTPFTQVSQTTSDSTKSPAAVIANANYDIFCWLDSSTFRCTRGDYWKTASTSVTISIASPGVVTCVTCSFNTNFNPPVVFAGTTPTGITAGTTYYLSPTAATTANVSATPGGSAINTSGSSSGVTAIMGDDFGTTYRSGTTSLTTVAGFSLNTSSITNGPAALRGTYVGTVRSDASATFNMTFGSVTPGGGPALLNVFNQYNQVPTKAIVGDSSSAWAYSTATIRPMNNSTGNRVSYLSGLAGNPVNVVRSGNINTLAVSGAYGFFGYAVDATNTMSGSGSPNDRLYQGQNQASTATNYYGNASGGIRPSAGAHFVQATELGDGSNLNTFGGSSAGSFLDVTTWQ